MSDLNEMLAQAKRRRVNHKDVFWLRAHLEQCPELTDADIETMRAFRPRRDRMMVAVIAAIYAPQVHA